jgi:hypothetical protein
MSDNPKIYESPDGGKTIRVRESGVIAQMKESILWSDIRRAAKTDPVLQEALDRAIILYQLSKEKYETE